MMPPTCDALIAALEDLSLPPADFTHRAHVQAGFAYLQRHGFAGALAAMATAIRRFAQHHGKAALYHETVTVAFLTLIHARMAEDLLAQSGDDLAAELDPSRLDWDSFAANHPDLFAGDLLARYYDKATLASPLARRCFVLPRAG
jgi:hypothetical protein